MMVFKTESDMKNVLCARFESDELILRDKLAIDRMVLANENAFLLHPYRYRPTVVATVFNFSILHL